MQTLVSEVYVFVCVAATGKTDLVTKKEMSSDVDGAHKSGRHYASMAHPVPSSVETPLGQGQDQSSLSSCISYKPIRFHGTWLGFDSLNTLFL